MGLTQLAKSSFGPYPFNTIFREMSPYNTNSGPKSLNGQILQVVERLIGGHTEQSRTKLPCSVVEHLSIPLVQGHIVLI